MESCVFEDCDLEDTSLASKPIQFPKMFLFHYKIGLIKLPHTAKVMENQNFKFVFTNLLKMRQISGSSALKKLFLHFKVPKPGLRILLANSTRKETTTREERERSNF